MVVKIGINGYGRIGRGCIRAAFQDYGEKVEVVAFNSTQPPEALAHMLKYDSVYGRFPLEVTVEGGSLGVGGKKVHILADRDPANLRWGDYGVDIVLEATGVFTKKESAGKHLENGAKKVIVTAPAEGSDATLVMGVNHDTYRLEDQVVSNASCTTNCLAPVAKVLNDHYKVKRGLMTTIHAYTNDQRILDLNHKDLRRARAAALSIIPTSTGAARAIGLVLPELAGKLDGLALRVPVPTVSMVDLLVELESTVTVEGVNTAMRKAAEGPLKDILLVCDEPLVSADFIGNPYSSIVDSPSTMVSGGNMVKIMAWYDNEWAYCCRTLDLAVYMAQQGW